MEFKDELIGELCDNVDYYEILELLDMTDVVDDAFDKFLKDLSEEELIQMFEDYCYDYMSFLDDRKND